MLRITSLGVRVLHPMNPDSLTAASASVSDVGRIAEVQIINATSKASLKTDLTQNVVTSSEAGAVLFPCLCAARGLLNLLNYHSFSQNLLC